MNEIKNDDSRVSEGVVEEVIDQESTGYPDSSFEEMSYPQRPTFGYSLNSSQLRRRAPMVEKTNLNELPKASSDSFTKQQSSQPGTSEQKPNASTSTDPDKYTQEDSSQAEFTCNICFDTASGPVVTLCGHLYCWSCLHRWLQSHRRAQLCPVCKAGCSKEQVIPIYGRGKEANDPRLNEDIPQRPQAQRPAPQPTNPFDPASFLFNNPFNNQNNNNHVFQFHFFPGLIPSIFSFNFTQNQDNNPGTAQVAFLNRLFFMIGMLILACILLL